MSAGLLRRILIGSAIAGLVALLAACGQKGPLALPKPPPPLPAPTGGTSGSPADADGSSPAARDPSGSNRRNDEGRR